MCVYAGLNEYTAVNTSPVMPTKAREEGVGYPGPGKRGGGGLTSGCWASNLGSLEEQPVLLTSQPSLQPQMRCSLKFNMKGC